MLLEVGFVVGVYIGVRRFEHCRKNANSMGSQSIAQASRRKAVAKESRTSRTVKPLKKLEGFQQGAGVNETKHKHYLKLSTVAMGLAAIRQVNTPLYFLSLGAITYITLPILKQSEKSLIKERRIDGYVLDLIVIIMALGTGQHFAAAVGAWFYHLGKTLLQKTQKHSEQMLVNVFDQQPHFVWILKDEVEIEMPLAEVHINDIVVVNTAEVIPIDGIINKGIATIDQHALTGEFQPAEKGVGDHVFASTIVIAGKIYVRVEKAGSDTTISKIGNILSRSANFKTRVQSRGEELADKAVMPLLFMGILALPILGPVGATAVINSSFGGRIRVLAPLGTLNHINLASHKGILIKDGRAIEFLSKVDTILFDKTGTLTSAQPEVGQIITCNGYQEDEILRYAATAERKLAHPIAKAIVNKAKESNLNLLNIDDSKYQIGYGIKVNLDNKIIRVGSIRFMAMEGIAIERTEAMENFHAEGHSLVMVAVNHQLGGVIKIQASVRSEVKNIINGLRQRGIKQLAIVSGDHKQPTQSLAESLGMDSYFYDILPEDKANIVEQLQKEGKSVCFVGDGINDAIAMKKANISISLAGASSIATDIAQVILMDGSLSNLCYLFDISKNLDSNLHNSFNITLLPGVINIASAFLLHSGITTSIIINNVAFLVGMVNVMRSSKQLKDENSEAR
ncbi:MAG: heavy metal translocating P-type ATPase [Candidatus Parabeggiatoa sp. nov. 2]|nr:MAG: hypothetical protein B6247_16285 [Beggiatoa sp. 4572_84]RKZ61743.1 MAG: heavy metal translocating P-type ATPase [Gammaproteobacteria bacterium]HEC84737.1 heavy metal translocating P-type ATPase [Thioploca sp.]